MSIIRNAVIPILPVSKPVREYTGLELVQMIAFFYCHQGAWPYSTKSNQWDDLTLQTEKAFSFDLPNRANFTSRFETYDTVRDLVRAYLGGQDLSIRPLLQDVYEKDICTGDSDALDLQAAAYLFVRFYARFSEYPQTGPGSWNWSTLTRCRETNIRLPYFRIVDKKWGMTLVKAEADRLRAQPPRSFPVTPIVEKPAPMTPIVEKPAAVTPTVEKLVLVKSYSWTEVQPEKPIIDIEFSMIETTPDNAQALSGETTELFEENKQLQEDVDQASAAIDNLRAEVKHLRDTNHKLMAENQAHQETIKAWEMVAPPAHNTQRLVVMPLAVKHLVSPFTIEALARHDADSDMVFVRQMVEAAARALGLEVPLV